LRRTCQLCRGDYCMINFKNIAQCLLAALIIAVPQLAFSQQNQNTPERYVAQRILVQPKAGLSNQALDQILKPFNGVRKQSIKKINVHVVELPMAANAVNVAQALRKNKHIKSAEVDGLVEPILIPNDPYFSSAWHLPKINAPAAWDYSQGTDITIAILDTGTNSAHIDLIANIVPGWNFFDNNNDTSDVHGHGTATAGVASAVNNNGTGVASIGFSAKIMPIRISDLQGYGYYSTIANGIIFAADNGARIASISYLGISSSSTVRAAADYMRSNGGIVVTAGGNTNSLRTEPDVVSITSVSATDNNDNRASFSSWGDYIDLAAPGVSILTTTRSGGYAGFSGTSASSPLVAGVYALMLSIKPTLTPFELDTILFSTAVDLGTPGEDQEFGAGRVDAGAAVLFVYNMSPTDDLQPPTVNITSPTNNQIANGLTNVNVTAQDNIGVTKVALYINNILFVTDFTTPYGFTFDTTLYNDGPLTLQTKAYDAAGNEGSSAVITVNVVNDIVPPTVQITSPLNGDTVSGIVTINVVATDNKNVAKIVLRIDEREVAIAYGATLSYAWTVPLPKGHKGKGNGQGRKKENTTSIIEATAFDAANNVGNAAITVNK